MSNKLTTDSFTHHPDTSRVASGDSVALTPPVIPHARASEQQTLPAEEATSALQQQQGQSQQQQQQRQLQPLRSPPTAMQQTATAGSKGGEVPHPGAARQREEESGVTNKSDSDADRRRTYLKVARTKVEEDVTRNAPLRQLEAKSRGIKKKTSRKMSVSSSGEASETSMQQEAIPSRKRKEDLNSSLQKSPKAARRKSRQPCSPPKGAKPLNSSDEEMRPQSALDSQEEYLADFESS